MNWVAGVTAYTTIPHELTVWSVPLVGAPSSSMGVGTGDGMRVVSADSRMMDDDQGSQMGGDEKVRVRVAENPPLLYSRGCYVAPLRDCRHTHTRTLHSVVQAVEA